MCPPGVFEKSTFTEQWIAARSAGHVKSIRTFDSPKRLQSMQTSYKQVGSVPLTDGPSSPLQSVLTLLAAVGAGQPRSASSCDRASPMIAAEVFEPARVLRSLRAVGTSPATEENRS